MTISPFSMSPAYWGYSRLPSAPEKSSSPAPDSTRPDTSGAPSETRSAPMPPVEGKEGAEGQQGGGLDQRPDSGECQTCKNRTYQDGSDDPGVSFKTPTSLSPDEAASMVRAHEMEHVVRNQQKAMREDRKVVSQSVAYHNAICPECGRTYVSGGTTRTVTRNGDMSPMFQAGVQEEEAGQGLSLTA